MTESKNIMIYDNKEFLYILNKKEKIKEDLKQEDAYIPFLRNDTLNIKSSPTKKEIDPIDKKRELKRWKKSFSYYCLHPEKFKFGFKDLK
ncbi:MAG: hypothetical protein ACFFEY_08500 [Candidatus Thorarchaeota archaeon]